MTEPDQVPLGVDPTRPSPARLYDYFLGGTNNLPVDREAAERLKTAIPDMVDAIWANRGFHGRAAVWLADHGIRQFIDIGSGLPTRNNTHQAVHRVAPDARVVYVQPAGVFTSWRKDDAHVYGGSLYTVPYSGGGAFGTPAVFLQSAGENNYYPGWSADGQFVIFNRAPLQGMMTNLHGCANGFCPNDSFSNPKARVWILPTQTGATPIDCEAANGSPAAMPVDVSNSWPRWSPS